MRSNAQGGSLVLERNGRVISLERYAPNVVRVTMSVDKAPATSAPGYGVVGLGYIQRILPKMCAGKGRNGA